jgi:hypothetical protein
MEYILSELNHSEENGCTLEDLEIFIERIGYKYKYIAANSFLDESFFIDKVDEIFNTNRYSNLQGVILGLHTNFIFPEKIVDNPLCTGHAVVLQQFSTEKKSYYIISPVTMDLYNVYEIPLEELYYGLRRNKNGLNIIYKKG